MRALGLSFVRNAEAALPSFLDSMSVYCDDICVIDDRSTDRTADVLAAHPSVATFTTIDPQQSDRPWYTPEGELLNRLYRMADDFQPDWVIMLSIDERIEPAASMRNLLRQTGSDIAGLQTYLASSWNDATYPHMVPLMGQARSLVCRIWRYRSGLVSGSKRLHNHYSPVDIRETGRLAFSPDLLIDHRGWSTLEERIAKVDLYTSLDLHLDYNDGVPYDLGLLFGFERHRVSNLIQEYEHRVELLRESLCMKLQKNNDII